jgi:hypothetical protein
VVPANNPKDSGEGAAPNIPAPHAAHDEAHAA